MAELESVLFSDPEDDPAGKDERGSSSDRVETERSRVEPDTPVTTLNDAEVHGEIAKAILETPTRVAVGQSQSERNGLYPRRLPSGLFLTAGIPTIALFLLLSLAVSIAGFIALLVAPIHEKAMPVILTTKEDVETWLTAPWSEAKVLQRPAPDDALVIVPKPATQINFSQAAPTQGALF